VTLCGSPVVIIVSLNGVIAQKTTTLTFVILSIIDFDIQSISKVGILIIIKIVSKWLNY